METTISEGFSEDQHSFNEHSVSAQPKPQKLSEEGLDSVRQALTGGKKAQVLVHFWTPVEF